MTNPNGYFHFLQSGQVYFHFLRPTARAWLDGSWLHRHVAPSSVFGTRRPFEQRSACREFRDRVEMGWECFAHVGSTTGTSILQYSPRATPLELLFLVFYSVLDVIIDYNVQL